MTIDLSPPTERSVEPAPGAVTLAEGPVEADVLASVRQRLLDVPEQDVERLVHEALVAIGPVRVTTYLPILVERRVRQGLRATA
jgi:hypothetical protein